MKPHLILESYGMTDTGLVRENNEDYYIIDKENGLFIVADGLGGQNAGEVASQMAAESIADFFKKIPKKDNIPENIDKAMLEAHRKILKASSEDHRLEGMATTVVLALWDFIGHLYVANIGDSRAYLYKDLKLELVTKDHTVLAELVEQGMFTKEDLKIRYLRNSLTRVIGSEPFGGPYQKKINLKDQDIIILCSDGLWDMISDKSIKEIISQEDAPKKICASLLNAAKSAGGRDNITLIVIKVGGGRDRPLQII